MTNFMQSLNRLTVRSGLSLGVVVVTLGLSACGDNQPLDGDPEARHCEAAAQRLTREVGHIDIIESKGWTQEDVRHVRVRFAYPQNNSEGLLNGSLTCSYPFTLAIRGDKSRYPQAQAIFFRARNLSQNELLLLNMGLRGTKPAFKLN